MIPINDVDYYLLNAHLLNFFSQNFISLIVKHLLELLSLTLKCFFKGEFTRNNLDILLALGIISIKDIERKQIQSKSKETEIVTL